VEGQLDEGAHEVWRELSSRLEAHAGRVALSEHIEGARAGFEPLSAAVEALLVSFGNPLEEEVHVAFCPMAMGSQGARWVQQGDTVRNAYFGASMPECGELRQEVAPGTYLTPLDAAGTTP
jgi:Cu(I)/Ag(I) efflux system membrane fusion protein